jgi:hypothetical protein
MEVEQAAEPCLDVRKRREVKTQPAPAPAKSASAGSTKQQAWMVVSEIPASLDAAGLFDPVAASQLMILKNLEMQFRASGLRLKIHQPETTGFIRIAAKCDSRS